MSNEAEQIAQRQAKLEELVRLGVAPYPNRFERSADDLGDRHGPRRVDGRSPRSASGRSVRVAGRILGIRGFGKANFLVLSDGRRRLQVYVREDSLPRDDFKIYQLLDLGDHIGVEGRVFRTKTNELTVWAERLHFLAKCLLPLPEKWHGLTDVETRYRQRYLDLIVNPDVAAGLRDPGPGRGGDPAFPRQPGVPRGRDADDAADRRRRAGAAVRHASQHARHRSVPARRAGAVPQAADRRRASNGCTRSTVTSGMRGFRPSTTPSSRCWSSTRPTSTTST